jgi:hypothetical protein
MSDSPLSSIRVNLLNTRIYMTERKTHPSECGWDVSDH